MVVAVLAEAVLAVLAEAVLAAAGALAAAGVSFVRFRLFSPFFFVGFGNASEPASASSLSPKVASWVVNAERVDLGFATLRVDPCFLRSQVC